MAFFVKMTELCNLSGRTRGDVNVARTNGRIPCEIGDDGIRVFDVDDPKVQAYIKNHASTASPSKIATAQTYAVEFAKRRKRGDINCALTGEADLMFALDEGLSDLVKCADEEQLDIMKKQKEVEYKDRQIKKMDIQHKALTGDLIERDYVASFVQRYLGALHQKHLDLAGAGICVDMYNIALKNADTPREGEKEMEKILSVALSDLLKESTDSMDKNRL